MNKFLIRKDVYGELIEKGYGKKDLSKLTKKKITDKNGHTRTVYVRNSEQPATQQQPKAQDELSPEKKARYEEMLEQVKAGPEENALFVRGKGMLNKKDAIAHLEGKLGKKTETKLTQNDTKEEVKANLYKKVEFTPKEMKAIREEAKRINYKPGMENSLLIALKNRNDGTSGSLYFKNREIWNKTGMVKDTNSDYDLIKKKIKSMNGDFGADESEESGMLEKRYNNLKEGDEVTAFGRELKVVKKNEYNKTIKAEFVTKDGRKHTTDLSIMDIDDSSFDKDGKAKKSAKESKSSVNGFTLDDIYHHGSGKEWAEVKRINDMETAKGVVEMIAQKYGATDKGREQLMDFIAYNIGGTNPLYDKLYEEYGVDADDLDMDFEASHDLILNQAMGKDTKKNREQIADSKSDFERRYRQMLEREG